MGIRVFLATAPLLVGLQSGCYAHYHPGVYASSYTATVEYSYSGGHPLPDGGWCPDEGPHEHVFPPEYEYYSYSLSRSWKSVSSGKTGYSKEFSDKQRRELVEVVNEASDWIAAQNQAASERDGAARAPVAA